VLAVDGPARDEPFVTPRAAVEGALSVAGGSDEAVGEAADEATGEAANEAMDEATAGGSPLAVVAAVVVAAFIA